MTVDALGHELLTARVNMQGALLAQTHDALSRFQLPKKWNPQLHTITTGIGSSEAHAKYVTYLINKYTIGTASFRPLSTFLLDQERHDRDNNLVIFSQGLSPNAHIAMKCSHSFANAALLTAYKGPESDTSPKGVVLKNFINAGALIIPFLPDDEYEILIRILGPICGYYAGLRFVELAYGISLEISIESIIKAVDSASSNTPVEGIHTIPCMQLITTGCEYSFAENLAFKLMEGLLIPQPTIVDALSYCHGHFQQNHLSPTSTIILSSSSKEHSLLEAKLREVASVAKTPIVVISSSLPEIVRIFEYEAILNKIVLDKVKKDNIDQRNWPGKGCDDPLYQLSSPFSN